MVVDKGQVSRMVGVALLGAVQVFLDIATEVRQRLMETAKAKLLINVRKCVFRAVDQVFIGNFY